MHSSKGFSYTLYSHTRIPCIQIPDGGLSPSQTHRLLRLLSGRAGRRGGILPRILQQHAPAEPDFIPRLSGELQQATREEWIAERAGRGTEGLLCAFASSEDALGIAAGRLRVRWMLMDGFCMLAEKVVIQVCVCTNLNCCILNVELQLN